MPRHAHRERAPPGCCSCCHDCGGGCAPAPCYYPAPLPAPCYYPAPVPAPPGPGSSTTDQLLHAIAAHLLLGSSAPAPPPQPQQQQPPPAAHHAPNPYPYHHQYQYQYQQQEAKPHTYAHPPPPPPDAYHAANPYPYHHQYQYQQQEVKSHAYAHPPPPPPQQQAQPSASDHGHLILHSLLRRVAALESALPRCFPPPPPARRTPHSNIRPHRVARQELLDDEAEEESESSPPTPPPPRRQPLRRHARAGRPSPARELAARTIQAHFRRFLARRSRTLRQLKELAVLRSKAAALQRSLSGRRGGVDPVAVSEAAMGLLLRLDAIQGGDPMIREGKRAVSRELTRILEFVDKVLVKEHGQLGMGNALDNDECHEGCSAEFVLNRPIVNKKKVSFSSNGQIHELNGESDNVKEVDEASESSGSAESDELKGMPAKRSANGKTGIAAPTPMHMESRSLAGERR